ncbi:MAG: hypothetical protein C4293_15220, partial [Nitrospiraceae bacterium]
MPGHVGLFLLFLCFFISGATALIYEVVWLRMLGLVFGRTVYALTTVLGSLFFGRLTSRFSDPIRVYGRLEIGIGVFAAVIPVLLHLSTPIYIQLQRSLSLSYDAFSFVQFLITFVLLLVQTTLMGGTLPILSHALFEQTRDLGHTFGTLYAVNTAGAVLGVVLAGYFALPTFGNQITLAIAAIANVLAGVLVIAYAAKAKRGNLDVSSLAHAGSLSSLGASSRAQRAASGGTYEPGVAVWLILMALSVSGAVSMLYEVAWTRALTLLIGSSTYAFTSMLVAFLLGIALGSAVYTQALEKFLGGLRGLAVIQAAIGFAVLSTVVAFEQMPEWFLTAWAWSHSPAFMQWLQVVLSITVLLIPAMLIGATLPCALSLLMAGEGRVGQRVGQAYAANTVGAVAGTIATGFLLVPTFGVHGAITLGIAINLLVGLTLFLVASRQNRMWRWSLTAVTLLLAVIVLALPSWDRQLMSSGPAIYAQKYSGAAGGTGLRQKLSEENLLFYRDGISSTISVHQNGQHLSLKINGKADAGTGIDMGTQLMLAHPL